MPSLYEFYVIFSVFAILNARFFYHVGIYNFVRAINISGCALTSSNVHLDFQLTRVPPSCIYYNLLYFKTQYNCQFFLTWNWPGITTMLAGQGDRLQRPRFLVTGSLFRAVYLLCFTIKLLSSSFVKFRHFISNRN